MKLWIERYNETKYFAVYDGSELVAVCVYKRGAKEVKRRLEELERRLGEDERVEKEEAVGYTLTVDCRAGEKYHSRKGQGRPQTSERKR